MKVPEKHVVTEGRSLRAALDAAAALLGVPATHVEHKLDMAHFRSALGMGVGADTVKIFAWAKEIIVVPGLSEGEAWVTELLKVMGIEGKVQATSPGANSVIIQLDVGESAPHMVGKRGTTLRAIQHLMNLALGEKFPEVRFQLDVTGGHRDDDRGERRDDRGERRDDRGERRDDRGERRDDRGERRDDRGPRRDDRGERRDDRGPRRDDRGERRDDRGPRRDDRGPRRDDRRDDRGPRRGRDGDEDELKKLARKLAQRVLATGEPEQIRRELNSYDRRVVHLEIANIPGVASRSIGEGHERRLEILLSSQKEASNETSSDSE